MRRNLPSFIRNRGRSQNQNGGRNFSRNNYSGGSRRKITIRIEIAQIEPDGNSKLFFLNSFLAVEFCWV